jgi:hypothetical protein
MKTLTKEEQAEREDCELYFKSGKPKKKYMLCRDPEYIREIISINGRYNMDWACGGNRCPFYTCGCDDKGREWEE